MCTTRQYLLALGKLIPKQILIKLRSPAEKIIAAPAKAEYQRSVCVIYSVVIFVSFATMFLTNRVCRAHSQCRPALSAVRRYTFICCCYYYCLLQCDFMFI